MPEYTTGVTKMSPLTEPSALSPSLSAPGEGPAFEMKFLIGEGQAREVEAWGREHLAPDPHGEPALGGAYRTTSLYCDTPKLDVYFRSPSYKRRKFRARRYGDLPWLYLERKTKRGERVAKRRDAVGGHELALLNTAEPPEGWAGGWFHRQLLARGLGPACQVSYQRLAFFGSCGEGPLRLTLDRQLCGGPARGWELTPVEARPLLCDQVILEFKFQATLPAIFLDLIARMRLSPAGVSKYRLCQQAWGAPAQKAAGDA